MPLQPKIQFDELKDWMAAERCTFRQLAMLSGLDKMTVQRLVTGRFKAFKRTLIPAIAKATQNAVGEKEFILFLGRLSAAAKPAQRKRAA